MIYLIIAIAIFTTELVIKNKIEKTKKMNEEEEILDGKIIVTRYHNKGAMLNFLEKNTQIVIFISGLLLGSLLFLFGMLIPKKDNKVLKFALALLIGGASSNVYDRIRRGYVVDYFSFHWLKDVVFNIADLFVMVGSVLVGICLFFKKK
ncbi:signal peptidase II [Anaerosporobacter faecicola]|uniref:signal peptidase II n=1 Tax=Anaerosporobacter faecicola TaxID=2718714 RepID=UPI00143A1280|nr:signal peptidase II [Anaerosporobacter faecicola]